MVGWKQKTAGLHSTHASVQSLEFEDCRLSEIEWAAS